MITGIVELPVITGIVELPLAITTCIVEQHLHTGIPQSQIFTHFFFLYYLFSFKVLQNNETLYKLLRHLPYILHSWK